MEIITNKRIKINQLYIVKNDVLISMDRTDTASYIVEDSVERELLCYYANFFCIAKVLYCQKNINTNKYEVEIDLEVYEKKFIWGDLRVDISKLTEEEQKDLKKMDGLGFIITPCEKEISDDIQGDDVSENANFYLVKKYFNENWNRWEQKKIKFCLNEMGHYKAESINKTIVALSLKEMQKLYKREKKPELDIELVGNEYYVEGSLKFDGDFPPIRSWQTKTVIEINQCNQSSNDYLNLWKRLLLDELKLSQEKESSLGTFRFQFAGDVDDNHKKFKIISGNIFKLKKIFEKEKSNELCFIASVENKDYLLVVKEIEGDIASVEKNTILGGFPTSDEFEASYSIHGEKVQLKRKKEAMDLFNSRALPIIHLKSLLLDKEICSFKKNNFSVYAPSSKEKLFWSDESGSFTNLPYPAQEEAIKIALNTHDLAVIQGPPGTGKTTVAKVISERISELYKDSENCKILLTSYQHVAVDNIAERIEVDGFPVIRGLSQEERDERMTIPETTRQWRVKKENEIKENYKEKFNEKMEPKIYPSMESVEYIKKLMLNGDNLFPRVRENEDNLIYETDEFFAKIEKLENNMYKEKYSNESIDLVGHFKILFNWYFDFNTEEYINIYKKFESDNLNFANVDVLEELKESIVNYSTLIEIVNIKLKNSKIDEINRKITEFIQNLDIANSLDSFITHLVSMIHEIYTCLKADFMEVLNSLFDEGEEIRFKNMSEKNILENFLFAIMNEDVKLKTGLKKYSRVYASTLQQIENLENEYDIDFHTVLIDEAGRASPLDLLIGMTKAMKKVVLLGDHKQLPHFMDEHTKRLLDEGDKENYTMSFLEKIIKDIDERAEVNEMNRFVMLDQQYRMHPVIGNVVSNTSYDGKLLSPRESNSFIKFTKFPNPVYWIDVKVGKAEMVEEKNNSWRRIEEVHKIQELVLDIRKENKRVSIGIITAYNAQKEEIEKCVKEVLPNDSNIMIGTIDSFQGREFDVVIFSIARSIDDVGSSYGNLENENRCNVAISRVKSLLLMVGQKQLIEKYGKNRLKFLHPILECATKQTSKSEGV